MFLKVGTNNKENREAWLEKTLRFIPPGSRILDAGAGERQYQRFCSHLNYVSQDFGKYDGCGDSVGLQTGKWDQSKLDIVSDITDIPEPDGSFDAIMCVEVFEHLQQPIEAITEFTRLLNVGGHLVITAPFCSLTHFSPHHYYTGFNVNFYRTFLEANGFQIVDMQYNGNYFEYLAQEMRRVPQMGKQYSKPGPLRLLDGLWIHLSLAMLGRLSKKDRGSNEMLSFGIHVHAIKER